MQSTITVLNQKYVNVFNRIFLLSLLFVSLLSFNSCRYDTVAPKNEKPVITDGLLSFISFDNEIKSSNPNYIASSQNVDLVNDKNGNPNSAGSFMNPYHNSVTINNLPSSIKYYTMAFWVNPASYFGIPYLGQIHIAGRYGNSGNCSMKIIIDDEYLQVAHEDQSKNYLMNTNLYLTPNVWTHLTVSYDGEFIKTYFNGVLKSKIYLTKLPNTANIPFSLGMELVNNNRIFNGQLDEFYLFNRALTNEEVSQIYEQ